MLEPSTQSFSIVGIQYFNMKQVVLNSTFYTNIMDKRMQRIFWKFCYATCLIAFIIWLINAIDNYQSIPTSSKVSYEYGDREASINYVEKILRILTPIPPLTSLLHKIM